MNDDQQIANEQEIRPDLGRRQLGIGLVAVLAGGLGAATSAQAFPRSSQGEFNAASRILSRYGVTVGGEFEGTIANGHDVLAFEVVPQPSTEYRQVVGRQSRRGAIVPSVITSVFGNDASFIHFHPGEIVPCVRTTIDDNAHATHELFDADEGGIVPCIKVASVMHDGGRIGATVVTVKEPDEDFSVVVGARTYRLIDGALVEQTTPPR